MIKSIAIVKDGITTYVDICPLNCKHINEIKDKNTLDEEIKNCLTRVTYISTDKRKKEQTKEEKECESKLSIQKYIDINPPTSTISTKDYYETYRKTNIGTTKKTDFDKIVLDKGYINNGRSTTKPSFRYWKLK